MSNGAPKRSRWKRWLIRLGLGFACVLLLVLGLVAFVLFSSAGTRLALSRGVSYYTGMIPGDVTFEGSEGALSDGVTITGLVVHDRRGEVLVDASHLRISLDVAAALGGTIDLGTVELRDVQVAVDGAFGDLAPEGPSEPKPESDTLGPDLPFELRGKLRVRALELRDASASVAVLNVLDVDLWAEGTRAKVSLDAGAAVPIADLDVHALSMYARWSDPRLELPTLALQTSEGALWIADASADLAALRFDLGSIDAQIETERAGPQFQEATTHVEGEGTLALMSAEVLVSVPGIGDTTLDVEGGLDEVPWASVLLDAGLYGSERLPPLTLRLDADGQGDLARGLDATLSARCEGCDDTLGPIDLAADARVAPAASIVRVDAEVTSKTVQVRVDGTGSAALGGGLSASVRIPHLDALGPLVRRFAPDLELGGSVEIDAGCGGLVWPQLVVCRAWGGVEKGVPVERVAFDVSAGVQGDRIAALVHGLEVDQGPARVRMDGGPARLLYTPEAVSARDVQAKLGTTTGMGTLSLDGTVELGDDPRLDGEVHVANLALSALDPLAPKLRAAGKLSADAVLAGSVAAPELEVRVRGRGLRTLGVAIGDLDVDARYAAGDLVTAVDAGGDLGTVALRTDVSVLVDAETGVFELQPRHRAFVRLDIRNARLSTAAKLDPALTGLRGDLDLHLVHSGPLASPSLDAQLDLRDGAFGSLALPDVGIQAHYARREADLELVATHPRAFDRLSVTARAPLALDILRGTARLQPNLPVEADVTLTGVDLAYARELDPTLELEGVGAVEAKLRGTPTNPELDMTVGADALVWQGRAAGELSLSLGYRGAHATAQAWASGPEFSGLGVDATVPITVDLATGQAEWFPDRAHELHIALVDVLVRPALGWVPDAPAVDADGRVDLQLDLTGSADAPKIALHTEATHVVYGGREVGRIDLDAAYADSQAEAEVLWRGAQGRTAWVEGVMPVMLDLPAGAAKWDRDGTHEVRLAIPKLDPILVAPFVDVGDFDGAFAVHAVGSGNLDAFDASLSARGNLRGRGASLPLDARIVVGPKQQRLSLDLGAQTKVRARTEADVPAIARGGDWKDTPLEASADVDALRLSTFAPFVPGDIQGLRGRLDVHVTAGGKLGKPTFDGELALRDGAMTVVPARIRLTDMTASSTFSDHGATLETLTFKAGDGDVSVTGDAVVEANTGVRTKVRMDVTKFPIRAPGLPRMALSTGLDANLFVSLDDTDLGVEIDRTLVDVYASSISAADPIPTNRNVVLADLSKPEVAAQEEAPADEAPSQQHIRVHFEEDIRIVGPSIDMRWGGTVETKTTATKSTTSGKLEAGRGMFSLLGNDFDLESGTVHLAEDGSGMPFLDVVATTSVDDVVITVTIRGPASKPEFVLSSVPALPQSEIFTILVTGTSDTQGADSEEVQDKAAAVLAAMSNGALQRQLGQALRVDKIGVGFGDSSDQPILSVGKNITRNVYAETEYHHNAPQNHNRAQLEVEYEFAPRWSLETFFGDAAQGGISVFWGFAFDTK